MKNHKPSYEELEARLADACAIIDDLKRKQALFSCQKEASDSKTGKTETGHSTDGDCLVLLSDSLSEMNHVNSIDEMCRIAAKRVYQLNPDAYVVVSLYDPSLEAITIRQVFGFGDKVDAIIKTFGIDPRKLMYYPSDMTEEEAKLFTSKKVEEVPGGLYALLTRKFSPKACRTAESLFGINRIYAKGFALDDTPYGGIVILTRRKKPLKFPRAIEILANQVSLTIHWQQTLEKLRASEERFRIIVNELPQFISYTDKDLVYRFVNKTYLNEFGLKPEDVVGKTLPEIIGEDAFEKARPHVEKVLNGEKVHYRERYNYAMATTRDIDGILVPDVSENEEVRGYYAVLTDLTSYITAWNVMRESEEKFRSYVENAGEIVYSLSTEGIFTYISPNWMQFMGEPAENAIGSSFAPYVHPEDIHLCQEFLQKVLTNTSPKKSLAYRVITRDGAVRWHKSTGSPLLDDSGKITGYIGIANDITEKKKTDERLKQSEREKSLILNATTEMIAYYNLDLRVQWANRAAGESVGQKAEDLAGRHCYEIWHNRDRPCPDCPVLKARDTGRYHQAEVVSPDGRQWSLRGYPIFDDQNRVVALVEFGRDITGRKRAEYERERLLAAIEQTAEIIVITDPEGTIQYVNPAFEKITGYLREEAIGKNPRILKSNEHDEAFYRALWETISNGTPWKGVFINKRKNGTLYHEENVISPVMNEKGKIVNYVAVKRDITHEIQMEEKLRQSRKMEAIGTLAAGIAHDFNNILFPIIGYSEMILDDNSLEPINRQNIGEILKAAQRAKQLVSQILTFGRKSEKKLNPISLNFIVEEALGLLKSSIPATIDIRTRMTKTRPVMADLTQIHQIIINLCTNAWHAMNETGGVIQIDLKEIRVDEDMAKAHLHTSPGDYVCLSVKDSGDGIDEEIVNRIFEPYFTTKDLERGTGLGLAVVDGIVKDHGGFVTLENEPGKGCTFHIFFPVIHSEPVDPEDAVAAVYPAGKERILFVDDDRQIVDMISLVLRQLGYRVTAFDNSIKALELFQKTPQDFDLIITDMTMPNMTGLTLSKEIRKIRADVPIIICTGYSDQINEKKCKMHDIQGYVMKPVGKMVLSEIIRNVLDKSTGLQ